MTITNLPSYPQQYITTQYHLGGPASSAHAHPHSHVHPAHPHAHPHHTAYPHHAHASHHPHAQTHVLAGPTRTEPITRKRPKYTRSKTGCLTCRVKKIKCDETKPTCTRCAHGQRECTWPESVPSRKKPVSKNKSEEPDRTLSSESASPSSSAQTTGREVSPARKSPIVGVHVSEGAVSSRRPHSESNTAAGSPIGSPIDPPSNVSSRRPSLQNVHSSSSISYSSNSQQFRQQQYSALTPPSVSPGSYHPSPASSHDYSSYTGSPVSNGHGGHSGHSQSTAISRHELPAIQTTQSRLSSDTTHNLSQWHTAPMMSSAVDPIEPFFRTVQERNLIRHFVNHSSDIQLAVPSEVNPFLSVSLPMVLAHPPGTDPATEALRQSLMGVAAIHRAFLLAKTGISDAADETMSTAKSFRRAATQCLTTALTTPRGFESNAALCASVTVALIDIFAGGQNWTENMFLAKTLVEYRQGPSVIMTRDQPKLAGDIAPARLLLEYLAVLETFGCLSSGDEPDLLSPESCSWWSTDATSFHVQSLENLLGISRDLMPHIARVVTYLSRLSRSSTQTEDKINIDLRSTDDAQGLINELSTWTSIRNLDLVPTRVTRGNDVYLKTLKECPLSQFFFQILLNREALKLPSEESGIQSLAKSIIDVCGHYAERSMGVHLIWPVLIAGSELSSTYRPRVLEVLEFLRTHCCYEIDTAERILSEVWSRRDRQSDRADWRSVIQDLNLKVLIV